jgi:hypothetical protein
MVLAIRKSSEDALRVAGGDLYPFLPHREGQDAIPAAWLSSNSRPAKSYVLPKNGRTRLISTSTHWRRLAVAIGWARGCEILEG